MHKPPPSGWPQAQSGLYYRDAAKAIDWLCDAFGFEVRLKVEGEPGEIIHSELVYGGAMIYVGSAARQGEAHEPGREFKARQASPLDVGGRNTQSVCLFVDDADAHCANARAHGAIIASEPATHDYGDDYWSDRSYGAYDLEGHSWWFMHRVREQNRT
ncbi:MAG TPA: VOC family protein [Burkholderiaceae bacterium]